MTKINLTDHDLNIARDLNDIKYLTLAMLDNSPIGSQLVTYKLLGITNPRQLLYHYINQLNDIPICACGSNLDWHADKRSYRIYCSKSCSAKYSVDLKKQRNLERYGKEWHSQLDDWKTKVANTSKDKYGVEHYSQTKEFAARVKSTNRKNLNVDYPSQSTIIKNKTKQTNLDRYGVENPSQSEIIQNKIKKTNLERYGFENAAQSDIVRSKMQATVVERYGVDHPLKSLEISKKVGDTRKLTLVMLLNEPGKDFTGGEFHINEGNQDSPTVPEYYRGRILAFPSFFCHRVTPVITGIRKSLVIWIEGPKFR